MPDITQEALSYLVSLGKKEADIAVTVVNDRNYTNKALQPLPDPAVSALRVSTLSGVVDLLTAGFEKFDKKADLVHVVSERCVQVVSLVSDDWATRRLIVDCNLTETQGFKFGQFLTHSEFLIGLMAGFTATDDRDYLLKLASSATQEKVVTSQDDGISQEIGVKAGAHLQSQVAAKNRVQLAPYRTFREVAQPVSEFVFRVQQSGDEIPRFALFEADGGFWRIMAIENVARNLRAALEGVIVVS